MARNMQVLRELGTQTAENSAATSASVGKLAELSAGLRKSVAGFRLPDKASGGSALLTDPGKKAAAAAPAPRAVPKKVSGLSR